MFKLNNKNFTSLFFDFLDIRHFSASLYCVFIICVFYYVAIFPFIAAAQLFFISKYDLTPAWANACNSLVYFMYVSSASKIIK